MSAVLAIDEETTGVTERLLAEIGAQPDAIGITNQRETTVVWDRATGKPIHQDRSPSP